MTSTGIQSEGLTKGHAGRPVLRGLSFAVASSEISGILGADGARDTTAVETIPAARHQDGGGMRHLVIFPAPVL